jgi:hypothetical protein
MAHCLWNTNEGRHNYHLVNWKQICMRKEFGGPGVPDWMELNLCLLGSWIRIYSTDKDKIWKMLINFKYNTAKPNIFTCKPDGASNFWRGVLWAANAAKMGYRWKVENGCKIRF